MIKITNITIKNFLSIGAVTQSMKLNENGLTLVLGANTDSNGGLTRNGAGKSSILQAISFALYGKPLTRIKLPNLINNINGKQMHVSVEFERDGKMYRIERGKKPDVMKFYVNDEMLKEEDETQGENRHTQEQIERVIGMSHTMFKHIVALNTFTDPFLKLTVSDQRAVIEELLGITQISQRAEALKKLVKTVTEDIRNQEARTKAIAEANDRLTITIRQTEAKATAWTANHDQQIALLAADLEAAEGIDFDAALAQFDTLDAYLASESALVARRDLSAREGALLSREATAMEAALATLQRESTNSLVSDQVRRLLADKERRLKESTRHEQQAAKLTADRDAIVANIEGADTSECVCCGQKLDGTDHLKTVVASLEEQRIEIERKIEQEHEIAKALAVESRGLDLEIERIQADDAARREQAAQKLEAAVAEAEKARAKVEAHAATLVEINDALQALGERPATMFKTRDEVYRTRQARDALAHQLEVLLQQSNPHISQVADLQKAIQVIDFEPLNDLVQLQKHQEFLLKLLTNKDSFIRKKIIDQNLSYLNARLNHYLDKLGLPHEVRFVSDLSVEITLLGRDFDFDQLSRGEMNRVIMATSWAFRDVWESMNSPCNLVWVDEMMDSGMDGQGVEAALAVLKSLVRDRGKSVFLISHKEELMGRIDKTLMVRKENGFTTIDDNVG